MFALVLWTETKDTSVVDLSDTSSKSDGNDILAKWGNEWYPAKLLTKSSMYQNIIKK